MNSFIKKYQIAGSVTPRMYDNAMEEYKFFMENPATWQEDPDMKNPDGSFNLCLDCIKVDWTNPEDIKDAYRLIEEGYSKGTHYNHDAFVSGYKALGLPDPVYNKFKLQSGDTSLQNKKAGGQMIKRADGSYSQKGFWDYIRENAGSGKKPTKEMLAMEEKLNKGEYGGQPQNAGFQALPNYVQEKILSRMDEGGEPNGGMALGQIMSVADKMNMLSKFISPDKNLDPWIASKLAVMDHSAAAIADYMMYNPEAKGKGEEENENENEMSENEEMDEMRNGGIHINPSKKGTFKAQATRMGMSVQEAASHIMANKEDFSPEMVKKAVFAHNFANQFGGIVDDDFEKFELGGDTEELKQFVGGGLNFEANPELSYGKTLDSQYKAGDHVDYKISKNLLENLDDNKFNRRNAALSGLASPNSFAQYLPNEGLGSRLKGWMGLLGAAGSLGLAGSKLANLGNNTKVESNLYNDTTKESGSTKDILQARLDASGAKSTTPKFSMANFASQMNDMEKEKMKNFQTTPENNSENYKQFMPQLNFKPEADAPQKQASNAGFPQDLLRKQTPNILSPDFNGSIETTPSTSQYNQFIPQAAFDSRYSDKNMPIQSFMSQPLPAGTGPQRNQSMLSTDYDGSPFENSGQETYNRNTYPNPVYTPAMLQNIMNNVQTKRDGGLTKFWPGGPFTGNPLQATFNAQGIGTSGMGNTITGGNYMDFNGVSPEQVKDIAVPQNNQTNQTITPTTYNTTYMDPVGMRAANNFITGLGMFNQSPIGEANNVRNQQRAIREAGNTDSMMTANNPQNPFGAFTPNAGPGMNFNLVSLPPVQDFGTKGNFGRMGGVKYREGGSYLLSKDQIMRILEQGGEIEYI